jgi:transposase
LTEKKTGSKYTREFKEEAVKPVTEQGYRITEAARNLGINAGMLGRWKRKTENGDDSLSRPSRTLQEELRRLRKENKRLQTEREILKKAAAFFAKESN